VCSSDLIVRGRIRLVLIQLPELYKVAMACLAANRDWKWLIQRESGLEKYI
jgi:hypothetical protein